MFKQLAVAAATALALGSACAADQTVSFTGNLAQFGSLDAVGPVLDGGSDAITFDNLAAGTYTFDLSLSSQHIDLTGVSLNGVAGTLLGSGKFRFAQVEGLAAVPFVLTVTGTPMDMRAMYSGEVSVMAVPEPETYSLMLAGLAAVGFIARRRRPA
jgi:hypothetical protein